MVGRNVCLPLGALCAPVNIRPLRLDGHHCDGHRWGLTPVVIRPISLSSLLKRQSIPFVLRLTDTTRASFQSVTRSRHYLCVAPLFLRLAAPLYYTCPPRNVCLSIYLSRFLMVRRVFSPAATADCVCVFFLCCPRYSGLDIKYGEKGFLCWSAFSVLLTALTGGILPAAGMQRIR